MKLLIITLLASLYTGGHKDTVEKWVIEKSSNLCVEGRSNVNSFRCEVTEYLQPDTLCFYRGDQQALTVKGGLTIQVRNFDCHQRYITGDLRKILKADESPMLKIDMLTLCHFNIADNKPIKGWVAIQMAGVTRKMQVNYTLQPADNGTVQLNGTQQLQLPDFGLTPPRKLGGLVKVSEQINVSFRLVLRPLGQ